VNQIKKKAWIFTFIFGMGTVFNSSLIAQQALMQIDGGGSVSSQNPVEARLQEVQRKIDQLKSERATLTAPFDPGTDSNPLEKISRQTNSQYLEQLNSQIASAESELNSLLNLSREIESRNSNLNRMRITMGPNELTVQQKESIKRQDSNIQALASQLNFAAEQLSSILPALTSRQSDSAPSETLISLEAVALDRTVNDSAPSETFASLEASAIQQAGQAANPQGSRASESSTPTDGEAISPTDPRFTGPKTQEQQAEFEATIAAAAEPGLLTASLKPMPSVVDSSQQNFSSELDSLLTPAGSASELARIQSSDNPYLDSASAHINGYYSRKGDGSIFTNKREEAQNSWRRDIDKLTRDIEIVKRDGAAATAAKLQAQKDALIAAGLSEGFKLRGSQGGDPFICTGRGKCQDDLVAKVPEIARVVAAELTGLQALYSEADDIQNKANPTEADRARYEELKSLIGKSVDRLKNSKSALASAEASLATNAIFARTDQRKIRNTQSLLGGIAGKIDAAVSAIKSKDKTTVDSISAALQVESLNDLAQNYAFFGVSVLTDDEKALNPRLLAQAGSEINFNPDIEGGFSRNVGVLGETQSRCFFNDGFCN